tara:strand:+ start:115 stop:993 length:879 start_codon:yes stop_codon:yes gene_type:complete
MVNPFLASGQRRPDSAETLASEMVAEEIEAIKQGRRPGTRARYARMQAGKAARQGLGAAEKVGQSLEKNVPRGALFPRAALLAGAALPGLGTALTEIGEGRTAGAVAAPVGGLVGAGVAGGVARGVLGGLAKTGPAPVRLLAQGAIAAAPFLGGMIGAPAAADVAEKVKRGVIKEPTSGKEEELGSQLAAAEKILDSDIAGMKDLRQNDVDMMVQAQQRLMPLAEQFQRNQMIRQQAMINTLGNQYARLGTLATAGKLATGAQAEAGATLRTAMTANPYAGSVLQAPSISFG